MTSVWICAPSRRNNSKTILLSSRISTRRYAHKARRRESGTHSKKLKTQWGEDEFFCFLFQKLAHNAERLMWDGDSGRPQHLQTDPRRAALLQTPHCCMLLVLQPFASSFTSTVTEPPHTDSLSCTCHAWLVVIFREQYLRHHITAVCIGLI